MNPPPFFGKEVKCSAFDVEMIFHSHANKTDTEGQGFLELGSGLSSRQFQTNSCFVK